MALLRNNIPCRFWWIKPNWRLRMLSVLCLGHLMVWPVWLSFTEENARDVRVDPLQKLHTLHNLAEVCEQ
jgi:hypothetical protein